MPNMTLALPDELHRIMRNHPEIKWSEIARQAMKEYAKKLELLDDITSKSSLTEKDAIEIGKIAKRDLAERYRRTMMSKTHPVGN